MELIIANGIGALAGWLGSHQQEAYIILFLGAFFETLIGPSFFIPGEIFLLAGSILGGTYVLNIWYVALALYSGALLGDNSSYFIGYRSSGTIFKEGRRIFNPENYKKGAAFFSRYGNRAIFLARILGPLSWITPCLAGVYRVRYSTFLIYNTPGIFVGIGEFLIVGYFFGNQYQTILNIIQYYFLIIIVIVIAIFAIYWFWRTKYQNPLPYPILKIS